MEKFELYGVEFERMGAREAAGRIKRFLRAREHSCVFTPNFQMVRAAARSSHIREMLGSADLLLPDGVGITLLCRASGGERVPRITGIDTAHFVLRYAARRSLSVYLLGAQDGVAALAAKRLAREIPDLKICGVHHGYFDKAPYSRQNLELLQKIRRAKPDIVFVCFGFPAQEEWILQNRSRLPSVRLFMGLGGVLDVWSGRVRRAPVCFRVLGLEWLWRCVREPRRFARLFK